jgi:hypothetical protein
MGADQLPARAGIRRVSGVQGQDCTGRRGGPPRRPPDAKLRFLPCSSAPATAARRACAPPQPDLIAFTVFPGRQKEVKPPQYRSFSPSNRGFAAEMELRPRLLRLPALRQVGEQAEEQVLRRSPGWPGEIPPAAGQGEGRPPGRSAARKPRRRFSLRGHASASSLRGCGGAGPAGEKKSRMFLTSSETGSSRSSAAAAL